MSRVRQVLHSIGSSYVFLAANVVFSLGAIPLALFYLSKEEFGLWALITQVTGYLALIDIGMSASVGRVLFDFKDQRNGGEYGGVIKTSFLVLCLQGLLLFGLGMVLAPWLVPVLKIPAHLEESFITLLRWQCGITAAGFTTKIFGNLLVANNRFDIVNYAQAFNLGFNLVSQWLLLKWQYKLYSLPWSNAISWLLSSVIILSFCSWLKIYPERGAWGRASWRRFKELFLLAKDVFLMTVGSQFIMASQTVIVTRALGLEASAIWAVCTKTYSLVCQLAWRIYDFSGPALAEMIVRQERERFYQRFKDIVMVTASLSALVGIIFATTNNAFVAVWTANKVSWPILNNVLLGMWLVILSVLRCHTGQGLLTKQIGALRYIYLLEGLIYFSLANLVAPWGGFPAIIGTSIACSLLFSGAYGAWRTIRFFQIRWSEVLGSWLLPMWKMVAGLLPLAVLTWYATAGWPAKWQFFLDSLVLGVAGGFLLLRLGISNSLQAEVLQRAPKALSPMFRWLFPAKVGLVGASTVLK